MMKSLPNTQGRQPRPRRRGFGLTSTRMRQPGRQCCSPSGHGGRMRRGRGSRAGLCRSSGSGCASGVGKMFQALPRRQRYARNPGHRRHPACRLRQRYAPRCRPSSLLLAARERPRCDMPTVPDRISQPSLGRLQLRMRAMLRTTGSQHPPGQAASQGDAGRHSPAPWRTRPQRGALLRRADPDETPLSPAEVEHARRIGVIA